MYTRLLSGREYYLDHVTEFWRLQGFLVGESIFSRKRKTKVRVRVVEDRRKEFT